MMSKEPLLPIVKRVYAKTISADLIPSAPLSIEELAKGREIKVYPYKYDVFDGLDNLEDWLEMQIEIGKLKREWLDWSTSSILPIQLSEKYYYTSVEVFRVTAIDPDGKTRFGQNVINLFELNPIDWNIKNVEKLIQKIKDKDD
jgi:hypothetical protein